MIAAERERQISREGWTPEHDDQHDKGQLANAAACYAIAAVDAVTLDGKEGSDIIDKRWPWDWNWWKPSGYNPLPSLVKAGALIAAEIDRIQRKQVANAE